MKAEEVSMGRPNPRLATRPTLRMDARSYWSHYLTIADTRTYNQAGVQPLSIADTVYYLDLAGIQRGEPALKFFRVMRAMDNTYLSWWNKKNQA